VEDSCEVDVAGAVLDEEAAGAPQPANNDTESVSASRTDKNFFIIFLPFEIYVYILRIRYNLM